MASPQAEDGHIDIAHQIAERMAETDFCSSEARCIWVIWRKSWGWHKKTARIDLSEWEKRTKLKKPHIWRALARLELRQIITKNGKNEYAFQKDYDKWLPPIKDFFTKNGNAYFVTKNGTCYTKIGNDVTKIGKNEFMKVAKEKRERTPKETLKRNSIKETTTVKKQLDQLIKIYNQKHPEVRKLYGVGGIARARDYFEGLTIRGIKPKEIEQAILDSPYSEPWKIYPLRQGERKTELDRMIEGIKEKRNVAHK